MQCWASSALGGTAKIQFEPSPMQALQLMTSSTRITYIDGIRGWAALSVLLYHVFWECFGVVAPEFRSDHLRVLFGGQLAVSIFFILSGDALASPFVQSGNVEYIVKTAARRYFRLSIPIILSCTLTYSLMKLSLVHNVEAGHILLRDDWLGAFLPAKADFLAALRFATFDVFTFGGARESYHPFLWTMPIELLGSALVLLFLFIMPSLASPLLCVTAIALFLFAQRSQLGLFFFGIALSLARAGGLFDRIQNNTWIQASCAGSLAAVYGFYCYLLGPNANLTANTAAALMAVTLIYCSRPARTFFSNSLSRHLGYLSFPIYLVQFPVLISLTSGGVLYLNRNGGLNFGGLLAIGSTSVAVGILAAVVFAKLEGALQKVMNTIVDEYVFRRRRGSSASEGRTAVISTSY